MHISAHHILAMIISTKPPIALLAERIWEIVAGSNDLRDWGKGDGKEEISCRCQIFEDTTCNEERYQTFGARFSSFRGLDGYTGRKSKAIRLTQILDLRHRENGPFFEEWVIGPMMEEAAVRD